MMERAEITQQLRDILGLVLQTELPADDVVREEQKGWDSLRHVEIVFAVEDAFAVQLSQDEMEAATSLSRLVDIVESHLAS